MVESIIGWLLWLGSLVGLSCFTLTLFYLVTGRLNYKAESAPREISTQHNFQSVATPNLEIEALRSECLHLRCLLEQQGASLTREVREEAFRQLLSLLTNYPTVKQTIQLKPELPARNIISLLIPLDNLLSSWGYESIGKAWEQVPYDPQFHQADGSDIEPGELVYVRFVGYREGSRILIPAKVSRTLPGGAV